MKSLWEEEVFQEHAAIRARKDISDTRRENSLSHWLQRVCKQLLVVTTLSLRQLLTNKPTTEQLSTSGVDVDANTHSTQVDPTMEIP